MGTKSCLLSGSLLNPVPEKIISNNFLVNAWWHHHVIQMANTRMYALIMWVFITDYQRNTCSWLGTQSLTNIHHTHQRPPPLSSCRHSESPCHRNHDPSIVLQQECARAHITQMQSLSAVEMYSAFLDAAKKGWQNRGRLWSSTHDYHSFLLPHSDCNRRFEPQTLSRGLKTPVALHINLD